MGATWLTEVLSEMKERGSKAQLKQCKSEALGAGYYALE